MLADEKLRRYQTDDLFHAFTKTLATLLFEKKLVTNDIDDAVEVALELCNEWEKDRSAKNRYKTCMDCGDYAQCEATGM